MEANLKRFPVGSFNKKIKVINPLESEALWPLSREASCSCVWNHVTLTSWHKLPSHWSVRSREAQTLLSLAHICSVQLLSVWSDGKQASPISHISDYWRRHWAKPLSSCSDHSGRSQISYPAQLMDLHDLEVGVEGEVGGGRRVIFSNFLAGDGRAGREKSE